MKKDEAKHMYNSDLPPKMVKNHVGRPNQDRVAISVTISRPHRDRLKGEPNASQVVDEALRQYYAS